MTAEGRLVPRGGFDLAAPVQGIEISADGGFAAIVTGENRFGAERVLSVLRAPSALPEGAALPAGFHSVRLVQQWLNAAGFDAGRVDGIYGPRTLDAVRAYLATLGEAAQEPDEGDEQRDRLRAVVTGVFPRAVAD
ncbi:hypothetical protein GH815_03415 [Rhodovulum strictum]|uniref:Peptidoglycan binding-like domain-containing protein n=1 Tax=Rhodovulum strictum TaxID=58314 RepID=A0A844BGD3_9RHOB|nr:hypothetical protein [Rhodovulum strictum]